VVPVFRSIAGLAIEHKLNLLAGLMLAVNLAGIGISFWSGDPRLLIAKDAVISSVIGFALLVSAAAGRPLLSAALEPFLTRGHPSRTAAWHRLHSSSARFRHLEALFTVVWGLGLLADCAVRVGGAFTLPVTTMVWLGTVIIPAAVAISTLASTVASTPLLKLIDTHSA
jgi:hypothetical protein